MFFTTVALAAAAAGATPASPGTIAATYNPADGRYCIRATSYDHTDVAHLAIYRRTCLTEQQWRQRGVVFEQRAVKS